MLFCGRIKNAIPSLKVELGEKPDMECDKLYRVQTLGGK